MDDVLEPVRVRGAAATQEAGPAAGTAEDSRKIIEAEVAIRVMTEELITSHVSVVI
jgi:hypothetical protein